MSAPLISIVMPAFKCRETLAESVQSVLTQTYSQWELVISIDDGEDYERLLGLAGLKDPRIRFTSTGNVGTGSSNARNVGVDAARSNFIAVLDADDLFVPEKLEITAPLLAENPLISTGLQVTDAALNPLRQVGTRGTQRRLSADIYKATNISMDSMILYDRARLPIEYDVNQPCLVDMDLIFKAFCHTAYCLHLPLPLHTYRKQAVSISNGPAAADKFAKMKRTLLARLEAGYYDFVEPDAAKQGFEDFLHTSLQTELEFATQNSTSPHKLFEDLLESKLG
ncbi:putative glycosyltransferase EpsE [Maritalea myrionectae]|uniref:Putative glycosyltransferase EpsE n=1 Tax=Maritalea myrionectae TaxID=454601 RepID=A0A2R4MIU8_9HYPH|nr:glycosyltransferase family A protein [Maritalea myrionectae]AVX05890.1 putative glycosyltransferase EpsE [Maritalea myrionectae]